MDSVSARWVSEHWWSRRHELQFQGETVASVDARGSGSIVEVRGRKYVFERLRLPPYITLRDAGTGDLVVRFCLIPAHGFLAEFEDGEAFRLGWVNFTKREFSWTRDTGDTVLLSKHHWFGGTDVQVISSEDKWPLLAVLEFLAPA